MRCPFGCSRCLYGPYPQYGRDFPEEIPEKLRKDPVNALRAFPGIPLESTAGIPQALQVKAFEASRAFPEFSPPQYEGGRLFFRSRGPLRAVVMEFQAVVRALLTLGLCRYRVAWHERTCCF